MRRIIPMMANIGAVAMLGAALDRAAMSANELAATMADNVFRKDHHLMRGSKYRQHMSRGSTLFRNAKHTRQSKRIARQLARRQLDYRASGQPEIRGRCATVFDCDTCYDEKIVIGVSGTPDGPVERPQHCPDCDSGALLDYE